MTGGCTHFEGSAHEFQHEPKDLAADFKNFVYRARAIPRDGETKVELNSLQECSRLIAFSIGDGT
jgi:hypothetical protein